MDTLWSEGLFIKLQNRGSTPSTVIHIWHLHWIWPKNSLCSASVTWNLASLASFPFIKESYKEPPSHHFSTPSSLLEDPSKPGSCSIWCKECPPACSTLFCIVQDDGKGNWSRDTKDGVPLLHSLGAIFEMILLAYTPLHSTSYILHISIHIPCSSQDPLHHPRSLIRCPECCLHGGNEWVPSTIDCLKHWTADFNVLTLAEYAWNHGPVNTSILAKTPNLRIRFALESIHIRTTVTNTNHAMKMHTLIINELSFQRITLITIPGNLIFSK